MIHHPRPNEKPLLRLWQISDLHFGPPFNREVAEAALRKGFDLKPDVIIVNGDLTQRATREQFQAAREYLDRLPKLPTIVIPGNHDVPLYRVFERLFHPHQLYQEIISEDLNPVLKLKPAIIIGLDSTAPRTAITNGRINSWQLELCQQAFTEAPADAIRIVVAHHPFAPAPDVHRDYMMPQAKRAITQFVEQGVEMILGGHLHRAYIGNSLDFYAGSHRDRGIIIAQSGTTTSRRGRGREQEKNSFNLIEFYSDTIEIAHYLYFDEEAGFVPTSWHSFLRTM